MNKKKLNEQLEKRGITVTSLNRELLLYSEFKILLDWDDEDHLMAKNAFDLASKKVRQLSCTTEAERTFYAEAIGELATKVRPIEKSPS